MQVIDLIDFLEKTNDSCQCVGDLDREISAAGALIDAKQGNLLFCIEGKERYLADVRDCTVVVSQAMSRIFFNSDNTYILVEEPRISFLRLVKEFFAHGKERMVSPYGHKIHHTAIIDSDLSLIAPDVEVGPYTYISGNCVIGANTRIGSHVHIEGDVTIGKGVCIASLSTIGAAATGHTRNRKTGGWEYLPQIGGVVIGDGVDIGSRVNIHRAALTNTVIGKGSVIGVNCNIGHNVVIGEHTFVAGKCNLGGGTKIGDYCLLGLSVVTSSFDIVIGDNVIIGDGAVVTKDVKGGHVAYGVPAKVKGRVPKEYGE